MIGDRMEAERTARGWSMRTLAERSGISEGYLWLLAKNRRPNPTKDTLEKLAAAFGFSVDALLGSAAPAPPAPDLRTPPADLWRALGWPARLIEQLIEDWPDYTEAERLHLIRQAEDTFQSVQRRKRATV